MLEDELLEPLDDREDLLLEKLRVGEVCLCDYYLLVGVGLWDGDLSSADSEEVLDLGVLDVVVLVVLDQLVHDVVADGDVDVEGLNKLGWAEDDPELVGSDMVHEHQALEPEEGDNELFEESFAVGVDGYLVVLVVHRWEDEVLSELLGRAALEVGVVGGTVSGDLFGDYLHNVLFDLSSCDCFGVLDYLQGYSSEPVVLTFNDLDSYRKMLGLYEMLGHFEENGLLRVDGRNIWLWRRGDGWGNHCLPILLTSEYGVQQRIQPRIHLLCQI